jgi:hypothetical protein
MTESVGALLATVRTARQRLGALAGAGSPRASEAACELGRRVSHDVVGLLDDLGTDSPAAHAVARAAGERFDSHVLAATLLEASDASSASVFELVGRGLIRLSADLERLARSRRQPA